MRPEIETVALGHRWKTSRSVSVRTWRFRVAHRYNFYAAILVIWSPIAQAQVLPQPVVSNPVPQGSPIPRMLPPPPPNVAPGGIEPLPIAPSEVVAGAPVPITQVSVTGVTVYSPQELAVLTDGLVGPAVPFSRIDAVRQDILRHYRADGYVLSAVSASYDAPSGRLRFQVTEGHIASVRLDGDIGPAGTQVLRFL